MLKRCVCMSILNFNLITETDDFHNVFEVKEWHKNFTFSNDMEWHFIEVNKLPKIETFDETKELDYLGKWALFFKYADDENMRELIERLEQEVEEIGMAGEILERVSQNDSTWFAYHSRLRETCDKLSTETDLQETKSELNDTKKKYQ